MYTEFFSLCGTLDLVHLAVPNYLRNDTISDVFLARFHRPGAPQLIGRFPEWGRGPNSAGGAG